MNAQEKRDLGEAVAQDVEQDMSQAAERLALALVRHYRVELTDEAREFLAQTYGARPEVLAMLAHNQADESSPYCLLSVRPTVVPAPRMEWYRKLVKARRLLT
jgi:hypothetical protein